MQIYTVCNLAMAPTFMEIFFNHTDFLNLLCVDMLIGLFSFFQEESCHPLCFLKRALLKAKKLSWLFKIFLFPAATAKRHWAQCFGSRWVSRRISRLISLKYSPLQNFSEGQVHRFIMTDFVINFTLSKSSFFKNNSCCYAEKGSIGYHDNKFT